MRYRLTLSYAGTRYHGWQRQPNACTVEQTVEESLSFLLRERVEVVGCGRTDTGVHARYYVAHFDTSSPMPGEQIALRLNHMLPPDIAILGCEEAAPAFHARYDATARTYEYWIARQKTPFLPGLAYSYTAPLDLQAMEESARQLMGFGDFAAFCKVGSDNRTMRCRLSESTWQAQGGLLVYRVTADRFLRNMVRAMVGTLLEVGRHRRAGDLSPLASGANRSMAGESVPAMGLYLVGVEFSGDDDKP